MSQEDIVQGIKLVRQSELRVHFPESLFYCGEELSFKPVGEWILSEPPLIEMIATWREANKDSFFEIFPKSYEGTYNYLKKYSIEDSRRVLFILLFDGKFVGHAGFSHINKIEAHLDNVLKGCDLPPGTMFEYLSRLINWATKELDIKSFKLQVRADNERAIAFYKKLGFTENISPSETKSGIEMYENRATSSIREVINSKSTLRLWMTLQINS